MKTEKIDEIKTGLAYCTGTTQYYKHWLGLRYTDGVKYIADQAGAYWLIDLIASYQPKMRMHDFQVWALSKTETGYMAKCTDGNGKFLKRQCFSLSTFPAELLPFELWLVNGVLILPSEY
jgi:hypothetical protein